MTGVRLVGAVALSTISLVAVMWYLRRKKNDKKKTHNDKSENANCKEIDGRNSLRHISSQPLIVEESLEELTAAIEKQNEKEEETVVEEVVYIQASEVPKLLEEDSNNFKVDEDKIHIDKNLSTLEKSMFSEKPLKPLKEQNEVIHYTNNLDRSPQKASQKIEKPAQSKQNLNLTTEVSENISSENISVLNEAMTSSRMEEVSFINRNESEKVDQELANDPDTLSVSTIVPLMESTNLDITCSQAKDNDIVSDEMIRQESSTKLESSVCHTSQIILTVDRDLNHDSKSKNTKDSPVLENNSNKRNRYDSNCSSHSASHQDDKISETSSDRTASPFKERNSASPSKDFQHAVLENGVQGSDLSSCDSVSI